MEKLLHRIKNLKSNKIFILSLKVFSVIALCVVFFYLGIGVYFNLNKTQIQKNLTILLNDKLDGEVKMKDLELSFFNEFPSLTIQVQDLEIRDRLWQVHKKELLNTSLIYAEISPLAIFNGDIKITNLTVQNGTVDLYVDKDGYSNLSVFSKLNAKKDKSKPSHSILDIEVNQIKFKSVHFISENFNRKKRFDFETEYLSVAISKNNAVWHAKMEVETKVNSMSFSTKHGSFAKNKTIKGEFIAVYDEALGVIKTESKKMRIGTSVFQVSASFGLSKENNKFSISIFTPRILWKEAASLVSKNIKEKLDAFDLKDSIDVNCKIKGDFQSEGDPYINVITHIKKNILSAKGETVNDCFFKGEFTNNYNGKNVFDDQNSAILLHDFRGTYNKIPFVTKDLMISDITKPIASGQLTSDFDLINANNTNYKEILNFKKGTASIAVKFRADVVDLEMVRPYLIGSIDIRNADFRYLPLNFDFKNNSIQLQFTPNKLIVNNIHLETPKSNVFMHGYFENFMNLYYEHPEQIILNWDVKSTQIDLDEFPFLFKAKKNSVSDNKKNDIQTKNYLNRLLTHCVVKLNVAIDKLKYRKFLGTNVKSNLSFANDTIKHTISMNKENGNMKLYGFIVHDKADNFFNTKVNIKNISVSDLFYSFDNFGFSGFNHTNLKGIVNLDSDLKYVVTENGKFLGNSLNGNMKFSLNNGAFIDFKPIKNVGKFVFPFRDFKNISVENIIGELQIFNGLMKVKPMMINSSVINFNFGGTYSFTKGTNLQLDVHLRNPKKDENVTNPQLLLKNRNKGMIIHLQAVDDKEGKIKLKLRSKNEKLTSLND